MSTSPAPCSRSWSISNDSLRRYVHFATSDCNRVGNENDGWKLLAFETELRYQRRSGSFDTFRSRWLLRSISPQQFITGANAIDAAKQWDADLVEARYIKDLEDNRSIYDKIRGEPKPPLETENSLCGCSSFTPKEIAAGLHPKQNNAIRGLLLQSGWVVEKLENDSCIVTYVAQILQDGCPGFCESLNTKLVMIIENLQKQAQACSVHVST
ncbi:hypothetical protein DCAR_0101882 [Daucus carota subsp. sativus]|uniref:START domain-containing protein n=1 Tax=Daucus carota subsp. sativus TaxID=79200 RepID=A0AAF0W3U2_DAUCS|nr:hypothetical protein DCAR_0101882 [Daucus carota subsp. sativus]